MPEISYWEKRQDELKEWMERQEDDLKKRLNRYYEQEAKKLEREIASYYQQYGVDNVIQYNMLMQKLDQSDMDLLMRDIEAFVTKYPQYANLVPVRETIYKLNRLEGLQASIMMQQHEMAMINDEEIKSYLDKLAVRGSNMAMETLGFGKNFYASDSNIVRLFVGVPWCNGESFSTRIWNDTTKLAQYLQQDVAQGFARGDSYDKLVKGIRRRFLNVSRRDAYRLIYTEGTYVMNESAMQPFLEDFPQYMIVTAEDDRVCPVCEAMSHKVFDTADRTPGSSFPPFHPWCRCDFVPYVEDWDAWLEDYVQRHEASEAQAEKLARKFVSDDDDLNLFVNMRKKRPIVNTDAVVDAYMSDMDLRGGAEFKEGIRDGIRHIQGDVLENVRQHHIPFIESKSGSFYDEELRAIYLSLHDLKNKGAVAHEVAHALEDLDQLLNDPELAEHMMKVFNSTKSEKKDYSGVSYVQLVSPYFVRGYQGRTYVEYADYLQDPSRLGYRNMAEYLSVGYETFATNPQLLYDKDRYLYEFFAKGGLAK